MTSTAVTFRPSGEVIRAHDAIKLTWDAVRPTDGEVLGGGVDVLQLDADGRIRTDYQFIGS